MSLKSVPTQTQRRPRVPAITVAAAPPAGGAFSRGLPLIILAAALLAGLAIRLHLASLPPYETLTRLLDDDTFYYLQVARNTAAGNGVTFDGVSPTNGFQPLWMAILVLIFTVVPRNPDVVMHLTLALCSICSIASAYLVFRIISRVLGYRWSGLCAALFWALNYPAVIRIGLNGLETSLSLVTFALTTYAYLHVRECATPRRMFLLGMLLGIAVLARVDHLALALVFPLDLLCFNRGYPRPRPAAWVAAFSGMTLMLAPWIIWSVHSSGTPVPASGQAISYRHRFWRTSLLEPYNLLLTVKYIALGIQHLFEAIDLGLVVRLFPKTLRGVNPAALLGGLTVLAAAMYGICRLYWDAYRPLFFLILYASLLVLVYSTGLFPGIRYLHTAVFILVLLLCALGETLMRSLTKQLAHRGARLLRVSVILLVTVYVTATLTNTLGVWSCSDRPFGSFIWTMYDDGVRWINEETAPEDIIGSFNAGIYGYYSRRRVVNLDGVINDNAYRAIRAGTLLSYIEAEGIRYIVDWEGQAYFFLDNFGGRAGYRKQLRKVAEFTEGRTGAKGKRLQVFEVLRSGEVERDVAPAPAEMSPGARRGG